jgi:hypothetical protein
VAAAFGSDSDGEGGVPEPPLPVAALGVRESFSGCAGPSSIAARRRGWARPAVARSCARRASVDAAASGANPVLPAGVSLPSRYCIAHGE